MATILPAKQQDYSGIRRAAELIGAGFARQQEIDAEQAFRLKLLDEQFKRQKEATAESQTHAADLEATSQAASLEYSSDLDAAIQSVMRKYASASPITTKTQPARKSSTPADRGIMTPEQTQGTVPTSTQVPADQFMDTTTIYRQGKPIEYTDAELLKKGREIGFWDSTEDRFITYAEQRNKRDIELLDKKIEAESSLISQRKSSEKAEDARLNYIRAQTQMENLNIKIKRDAFQLDKTARDTQDVILTAHLADILTNGKYNSMSPEEQTSVRESLRAKNEKSEIPGERISKVDRHRYFYNEQAIEGRRKFFYTSLVPQAQQQDFELPTEGQVQYKDEQGRVETANYLFDQLYKEYAQQGRFEEAQRLPNAIVQAMKMYTMNGALPIQLSESQVDKNMTPNLVFTENGQKVIKAVRSLMAGNFEEGPAPLKDDERAKLENQIAMLDSQGLRVRDSGDDTADELYAKFGGMYQALTDFYITQNDASPTLQLPQFPMMTALAGAMSGVSDAKAKELVNSYNAAAQKNPDILSKTQAYKSSISTVLGNVALANDSMNYNLPNAPQVKDSQYSGTYYPEYFSNTPFAGLSGTQEIKAREILGSLINDYAIDNGEYISPETLREDLKGSKILQDSPALNTILMEYSQRYNSKTLPPLKR